MELDPSCEIKEECGIFGIFAKESTEAAPSIYYGLCALQHRGQESCGIAVSDTTGPKGNMSSHKDLGLVNEVLKKKPFIPFMETWVSATSATPPQEEIPPATPSLWCSITSKVLWLWPTTEIWSTQKNSAGNLKRTAPSSILPQILRSSPTVWQENGSTVQAWRKPSKKPRQDPRSLWSGHRQPQKTGGCA